MSVVSSTATKSTPRGASTGPRQPWAAQALLYGVNTAYGVPSSLVTRPGATAYGDPVRTSSTSCSASARATASSRRAPYGP